MDGEILLWIQENIRTEMLTPVMQGITFLGKSGWFWIVFGAMLFLFKQTRPAGAAVILALLFSVVVNNLFLKNLFARTRPYEVVDTLQLIGKKAGDYSFPSGHSGSSFSAATAFFCLAPKRYGIPVLLLAALIAFSRLYIGIHYPTDVLAGILDGIFLGWLSAKIICFLQEKREKQFKED